MKAFLPWFRSLLGAQPLKAEAEIPGGPDALSAALEQVQTERREFEALIKALQPGEDLAPLDRFREARPSLDEALAPFSGPGEQADPLLELFHLSHREFALLREVLQALGASQSWAEAGEKLRGLCQKPFGFSGFYLAHADGPAGLIHFPFWFEVGRDRTYRPLPLAPTSGLTGWALFEGKPSYLDTLDACLAQGAIRTPAEINSGLESKSWFGIPMKSRDPARPLGVIVFHGYHEKAFSPETRQQMEMVAQLASLFLDRLAPS